VFSHARVLAGFFDTLSGPKREETP
jgi:hypothetical protein